MKRGSQQPQDNRDHCKRGKNHEAAVCMEENAEHRFSEGISCDPSLEPIHKIFLSHSGTQKEFVELLFEALERRHHYPFFDKRPSSLPKGDRFPQLILKAAQQCEMAVVVVSEEYFMSKWPMIELHAFMQSIGQKLNSKMKVLPLFYGLSVSEFRDERRREGWYEQWETFAKEDAQGRINVNEWKEALDLLGSFNGISYNRELQDFVTFRNDIISSICHSIPANKWDDSCVQGKSNICEVICKKIQQVDPSRKYKVKVVGIHGVGGIGKTTICKTLCNEFLDDFEGKTCHLEFKSSVSSLEEYEELLGKVLVDLTSEGLEILRRMGEHKWKDFLCRTLSRQRTFLAVDNVWDSYQSIKQAKMFLEAPFHEGSLVIVTARSRNTLGLLGIDGEACFEMPELGQGDAVRLFLYHAARGKEFEKQEDKRDILKCIERCYFRKGDGQGFHYHPLALEAFGLQLGCLGDKPSVWVENLSKIRNFSYFRGGNPVFDIIRSSFDLLPSTEQSLFIDVVSYRPSKGLSYYRENDYEDLKEWLCLVHKQDEVEIKNRLLHLKARGLLQDVDMISGTVSMHDLYREFADLEVRGKLESIGLEKRRWVYVDNGDLSELESTPGGGCWHKLIRLCLHEEERRIVDGRDVLFQLHPEYAIQSVEGIEWQYCSNIQLLKLDGLRCLRGVLNLERLKCLRSLELFDVGGLDRLEGLEGLKNLTYFKWFNCGCFGKDKQTHAGQFPASLKVLDIQSIVLTPVVVLGPDVLSRCTNLCNLELRHVHAATLDLSHCSSLKNVTLDDVLKLRILLGLTASWAVRLQSLKVKHCQDLVDIPGLDQLVGLERLELKFSVWQELQHDLQNFAKVLVLRLRGLEQLQILDLSGNRDLIDLEGVGDLPALRRLNLCDCTVSSLRLPNLSKLRNLEVLDIKGCKMELHEEDICMLAALPLLHPVPVGEWGDVRLDLVRRKKLTHLSRNRSPRSWLDWQAHEWEETDLGLPPCRIRPGCIWEF